MQQTFQINTGNITTQVLENILATVKDKFGKGEDVVLTVKDKPAMTPIDQKELYRKSLELRELFKDVVVPAGMNLSDLANEVNL